MKKFLGSLSQKILSIPSAIKKSAVGASLLGATGVASADVATSITDAFSAATTNVTSVATGVIALAAVVTGVGLIIRFLSR
jgi:hypothetical protein